MKQLCRSVAVMLLVSWQTAENCPQGQYKNQDGLCCKFCHDGRFVTKNCIKNAQGLIESTRCKECRICQNEGLMMVSQCTKFKNTVCEEVPTTLMPIFTANSSANPDVNSTTNSTIPTVSNTTYSPADLHTVLYITLPLVLFLIIGIFACKKCVLNRYVQTKKTPYQLQQL